MIEQKIIIEENSFKKASMWRLVIGVLMVLLGLYVWFNPVASLVALALYIGITFIIIGAGYIVASFSFESGWDLFVGLLDVFVGLILVANLGVTAASLPVILAIWSLAVGIIQIIGSLRIRKTGFPWGWSLMVGILGVLFAFLILAYPMLGAWAITTIIGLYILLYGALAIAEYFYWPKN